MISAFKYFSALEKNITNLINFSSNFKVRRGRDFLCSITAQGRIFLPLITRTYNHFPDRSRPLSGERLGLCHLRGEPRGLHPALLLRTVRLPDGGLGTQRKEEDAERRVRCSRLRGGGARRDANPTTATAS